MKKSFSNYLDALRFVSAAFVVLFHIKKLQLGPEGVLRIIPNHGHDFVMVFFVLSGYLIAYSTDRKSSAGYKEYFLDRASRIYSVALPVLLMCLALSLFHEQLDPAGAFSTAYENLVLTFFSNFLFFSQAWDACYLLFWNGPYWSLSYEVIYYVLFGIFVFARSPLRWWVILIVMVAIGPKVILLLPCWLAGVLAYRYRDAWRPSPAVAWCMAFIFPVVVLLGLHWSHFGPITRDFLVSHLGGAYEKLLWSQDFPIDYVTAILVAINLYFVRYVEICFPEWLARFIKKGADISYSLYLAHMPFLVALLSVFGAQRRTVGVFILAVSGAFSFCWAFAHVTEVKRIWLRARLARLIGVETRKI